MVWIVVYWIVLILNWGLFVLHLGGWIFDVETRQIWKPIHWAYTALFGVAAIGGTFALIFAR